TAEEWLDVHNEHMAAEDAHREVTAEHDLTDVAQQRADDVDTVTTADDAAAAAEVDVPDIREVAATEEPVVESDEVRVPSADETAESVERAQRALKEIAARQAAEEQHAHEEAHAAELYRRNTADAAEADEMADADGAVYG
ncbi:hypothetical protein, partial [Amycolatopsis regifaucium]